MTIEPLPPLTDAEIVAGARPGESWEEARLRLERARRATTRCGRCGGAFSYSAHEQAPHLCQGCNDVLLWELHGGPCPYDPLHDNPF